ncbi:hypothetical protein EDD85DRAFT_780712, partial [Armillaria nabsnona]
NTFLHFYGEPVARLSRGTSIYDKNKVHKRSFLFHILKYLLFAAPCAHLGEIDYLLSDRLLSQIVCREFIDKICKDWSHPTIYSTVLINVDVGLLSIQSVDTSPTSSPLKGIIYLLILSALGSLFFAWLLLRHNKTRSNISTCEAVNIMNSYQDSSCRYDNIAIIYSLLYALLMWGWVLPFEPNPHFDGHQDLLFRHCICDHVFMGHCTSDSCAIYYETGCFGQLGHFLRMGIFH